MHRLRTLASRLLNLFRKRRLDENLDAELRAHLRMLTEENLRRGMSAKEAAQAARRDFGGIEQTKEIYRDQRGFPFLDSLLRDVRHGARTLSKYPGFSAVAILTLALGIGANTAIFSVVNSVLLQPLSYREPQQLYVIREIVPQMAQFYPMLDANLPDFRIWQKECHSFDAIAIAESVSVDLTGTGESEQIHGVRGSANLFHVLGARPSLGRSFAPEEDDPGRGQVIILTDGFWRERFQSDPSAVGRMVILNGAPYEIVGVLPASFHFSRQVGGTSEFTERLDFFQPLNGTRGNEQGLIGDFDFTAIARLKPGVSPSAALAELNVVQAEIAKKANEGLDLLGAIAPLVVEVVGPARRGLLFLLGAVGSVLLIGCVNLANLLLARAPERMREAAVRAALGATRGQLMRQFLIEALLLATIGGALGICSAWIFLPSLVRAAPTSLPRLDEIRLDTSVLWFSVFLSLFTGVLFGLLPAWRIARTDPQGTLKVSGGALTESRRTRRLREALVTTEVASCTVLLVLAGLLAASFVRVLKVQPGFTVDRVLTADVELPPQNYATPESALHFYERAVTAARSLPGVASAAWVSILPLEGQGSVTGINIPGRESARGESPIANYRVVSPGYFTTIGIPLIAGRDFAEEDRRRNVVIVSQSVAQKFWPNENPIGKTCITSWNGDQQNQVLGVVGDIHTVRLDKAPVMMVYTLNLFARVTPGAPGSASIVLRTAMDPATTAGALHDVLRATDPLVPITALRPMTALISQSVETRRFQLVLALLFASCALLLASLGIFGVVAYSVEQRKRELGIRMALGAGYGDLRGMVLRQGMAPVLIGLAAGVILALLAGEFISALLFGVRRFDPLTESIVTLVILSVALTASYIPAHRAMRVDPLVALRYE